MFVVTPLKEVFTFTALEKSYAVELKGSPDFTLSLVDLFEVGSVLQDISVDNGMPVSV